MVEALDIQVKGIVQGVGFRPFVYRLAKKYQLNGWVLNAVEGVFIHAEGEANLLDKFVTELHMNPPSAAKVKEIDLKEVPLEGFDSFDIRFSDDHNAQQTTLVSPDLATCNDCLDELFNPEDRRYRYPFINCTNCGPRFTIIGSLPYDRPATSMKDFPMCPRCAAEYADPLDRRFHAQPDACWDCGPHISWVNLAQGQQEPQWGDTREASDAIFAEAVKLLLEGGIVAVKGLGGFHLVCDASNPDALAKLRQRKRRQGKAPSWWRVRPTRAACAMSTRRSRARWNPPNVPSCCCASAPRRGSPLVWPITFPSWESCCPARPSSICCSMISRRPCARSKAIRHFLCWS